MVNGPYNIVLHVNGTFKCVCARVCVCVCMRVHVYEGACVFLCVFVYVCGWVVDGGSGWVEAGLDVGVGACVRVCVCIFACLPHNLRVYSCTFVSSNTHQTQT